MSQWPVHLDRDLAPHEWDWDEMIADSSWRGPGRLTAEEFICKYLAYDLPLPTWMDEAIRPTPPEAGRAWQRTHPGSCGYVTLKGLVGSAKWTEGGGSWKNGLHCMNKPWTFYGAVRSPSDFALYLNEPRAHPLFIFGKIRDEYFNLADGNNRLISAKFIGVRSVFGALLELD